MDKITFTLNEQQVEESHLSPTTTLLQYLRQNKQLTGTKEGCAEGDCGACTVVVVDFLPSKKAVYRSVNACLLLLPMLQGKQVYTVEHLRQNGQYHPVQEALVEKLGSQCGYCTPGIVMSMFEACYRDDLDEDWKLDDQMCGNLCRCTGYRPIHEAAKKVAGTQPQDYFSAKLEDASPESMLLEYKTEEQTYFNPTTFERLWELLDVYPDARFIAGGTDLALEITKKFEEPPLLISLEAIEELQKIQKTTDGWKIGASTPLSLLETESKETFPSLEKMLRFFGARQIKNRGTIGGNLCNASPIGDLAPVLLSLGAEVVLLSKTGERTVPLDKFFLDYRKTALQPGEILGYVRLRVQTSDTIVRASSYKVAKRQELDISAISAGFFVELDKEDRIKRVRLAFGGMAATPKRAYQTELELIGQKWSEKTLKRASRLLKRDFQPISDHRGSAWYRAQVASNLLFGFFHDTQQDSYQRYSYRPTGTIDIVEAN